MPGKKGKKSSVFVRLVFAFNILVVCALLMSYSALFIDPRTWWIPAFFGLSYPVVLALNLFFIILWLVMWRKYIFLSLITVLAGYSLLLSIYPLRFSKPDPGAQENIRLVTYNIHAFSYHPGKNKETKKKIKEFIRNKQPNILCLQEFAIRSDSFPSMKNTVQDLGFGHYIFTNYFNPGKKKIINGLLIASDLPITGTGSVKDSRKKTFTIYTDLCFGRDTIRLYNVHLASIHFAQTEYTFYETLKDPEVDNENLKEGIFKIIKKLKEAFIFRAEQVELLQHQLRLSPYPVILCGDFNDTPFSFSYHSLSSRFKDSFIMAGSGLFGTTYAGQLPSYRIDYVLFDQGFTATRYQKDELVLSDHFPVTVFLNYKKQHRGL